MDVLYSNDKVGLVVKKTMLEDLDVLSTELSSENVEEIWVAHHLTPKEALEMAFKDSVEAFTIKLEDKPIGIFGIRNVTEHTAEIYMVVTDGFLKIGRLFLRNAKTVINYFLKRYPYLDGWLYAKNERSIMWMQFCGATIEQPLNYGIENKLFRHFFFI